MRLLFTIHLFVFFTACNPANSNEKKEKSDPRLKTSVIKGVGTYDVWRNVWCPDRQNSGKNFKPVPSLENLPADPIGDGVNNCYMAAFDTSRFSTNDKPVKSCANLDLGKLGHLTSTCVDIRKVEDFKTIPGKRAIAVIMNDITGIGEFWMPNKKESMVIIGAYDEKIKRPVLLEGNVKLGTSPNHSQAEFTVINLRIKSKNSCMYSDSAPATQLTFTLQSVTTKCLGRFAMFSPETASDSEGWPRAELDEVYRKKTSKTLPPDSDGDGRILDEPGVDMTFWPVDDRYYLRNVMTRGGQSHTIYFDHNYLTWIQDSIILTPKNAGKHSVKLIGQNNVVHNSIFSNVGLHNQPIVETEPEWKKKWPHPKDTGMASFSLITCSRVVLDRVTIFHRFAEYTKGGGHGNISPIQWQFRDEIGAGCDIPFAYTTYTKAEPYFGPAFYNGKHYKKTPYWQDWFWNQIKPLNKAPWDDPHLLTSFITGVDLRYKNTETANLYHKIATPASVSALGTYPATRPKNSEFKNFYFAKAPSGWKERMRVIFNNNAFDQGLENPTKCGTVGPPASATNPNLDPAKHTQLNNIQRCFFVGPNTRKSIGTVDPDVKQARDKFLHSLPPPPWKKWEENYIHRIPTKKQVTISTSKPPFI